VSRSSRVELVDDLLLRIWPQFNFLSKCIHSSFFRWKYVLIDQKGNLLGFGIVIDHGNWNIELISSDQSGWQGEFAIDSHARRQSFPCNTLLALAREEIDWDLELGYLVIKSKVCGEFEGLFVVLEGQLLGWYEKKCLGEIYSFEFVIIFSQFVGVFSCILLDFFFRHEIHIAWIFWFLFRKRKRGFSL
jgi:hypothetical protein